MRTELMLIAEGSLLLSARIAGESVSDRAHIASPKSSELDLMDYMIPFPGYRARHISLIMPHRGDMAIFRYLAGPSRIVRSSIRGEFVQGWLKIPKKGEKGPEQPVS
jgi:hypothetical protein